MHIVHCLTHSIHGGGQAVPYLLVKNFLRYYPHVQHTVVLPSGGIFVERFKALGVAVVEFPFNTVNPINVVRIRSVLQQLKPDIIHTHGRGAGLYVRTISKKAIPAKRVHTHHGFHLPESFPNSTVFRWSEKCFLHNTDRVVSISKSEFELIKEINLGKIDTIKVIPNIVDREFIFASAQETADEAILKKLVEKFVVIMIGRDDPVKNFPLALQAAEKTLNISRNILFVFVGIHHQYKILDQLHQRYPENIIVLSTFSNPLPLLAKSSVLLLSSKREGAPLAVLEAFALGKPVIGTNVRGIRDLVHHEENGLLVEENTESVALAILRLQNDETLYKKLSANALSFSCTQSVDRWAAEYYSFYRSLIKR